MPIFEYKCEECSTVHEVLHKSSSSQEEIVCPKCNSKKNKKLLSTFSHSMDGGSYSTTLGFSSDYEIPSGSGCAGGMCGLN